MSDKITGSTVLPDRVLTQKIDTENLQLGENIAKGIAVDYRDNDPSKLVSAAAMAQLRETLTEAISNIDPEGIFFRDNTVITYPLLSPTFDNLTEWDIKNWIIEDNTAIFSNVNYNNDNYLRIPSDTFTSDGYHFLRIDIPRIDSGKIIIIDGDEKEYVIDTHGTHLFEFLVQSHSTYSFTIKANNVLSNQVIIVDYIGLHKVTDRIHDYVRFLIDTYGSSSGSGGDVPTDIDEIIRQLYDYIDNRVSSLNNQLSIHTSNTSNPHNVTRELLEAANIIHTHSLSSLGAAASVHTHAPEECGAAAVKHIHSPDECGAAPEAHTHTPNECGAAEKTHYHSEYAVNSEIQNSLEIMDNRINTVYALVGDDEFNDILAVPYLNVETSPMSIWDSNNQNEGHPTVLNIKPTVSLSKPIRTIKTESVMPHFSTTSYDFHSGYYTFYTDLEKYRISKYVPLNKVFTVEASANTYNGTFNGSFSSVYTDFDVPVFTLPEVAVSKLNPIKFTYSFHHPIALNRFAMYRVMKDFIFENTECPEQLIDHNVTAASKVEQFDIFCYNRFTKETKLIENVKTADIEHEATNGIFSSIVYIDNTAEFTDYEFRITEITTFGIIATSHMGEPKFYQAWSIHIRNFMDYRVDPYLVDDINIVGNIPTLPGKDSITLSIDTELNIPSSNATKSGAASVLENTPAKQVVLTLESNLNVSEGIYNLKTYTSNIPLVVSSDKVPDGINMLQDVFKNSHTSDIWGTISNSILTSTISTGYSFSSNDTLFTLSFKESQALTGIDFSIINPNRLSAIEITLTNTKNDSKTIAHKVHNDSNFAITGTGLYSETVKSNYFLKFDKVETNVVYIGVKFITTDGNLIKVVNILPKLIGLHYNPSTKTLYDHQNQLYPITILGKIYPVYYAIVNSDLDHIVFRTWASQNYVTGESDFVMSYYNKGTSTVELNNTKESISIIPKTILETNIANKKKYTENTYSMSLINEQVIDNALYLSLKDTIANTSSMQHFIY